MSDASSAGKAFGEGCGMGLAASIIFAFHMLILYAFYLIVKSYIMEYGLVDDIYTSIYSLLIALGVQNIWLMADHSVERNSLKHKLLEALKEKSVEG